MKFLQVLITLLLANICLGEFSIERDGTVFHDNEVDEKDLRKCFKVFRKVNEDYQVKLYAVKSREYGYKFMLKKFHPKREADFEKEVDIHSRIPNSPYFPKYFTSFKSINDKGEKIGCILMEYIDAIDLGYAIGEAYNVTSYMGKRFDFINWIKFIGAELATAIQILHDNRIVHRDIKPENVIIDQTGHLKLIDFGLAAKLENLHLPMWQFVGTRRYMAPELYSSDTYNYQVDWYSYGVTIASFAGELIEDGQLFYQNRKEILAYVYNTLEYEEYELIKVCTRITPRSRINSLKELKELRIFSGIYWNDMVKRIAQPPSIFFFFNFLGDLVECIKLINNPELRIGKWDRNANSLNLLNSFSQKREKKNRSI